MTEPGPGYAEGYLALFAGEVEEKTLAASDRADPEEAIATLKKAAEHAAGDLVGVERRRFLLEWYHGVKVAWDHLKEAYRQADEMGLEGDERRNFVEGTWWFKGDL